MKFAFLVTYELRCLKHLDKLYQHIVDFYDADIFICCQDIECTDKQLELFDKKVIFKQSYKKPNSFDYFNRNYLVRKPCKHNWNMESCLQIYINWNEMANALEDVKDNYDYFINIRTDIDILFPFPDKHIFEQAPKGIYAFGANYCERWGGMGFGAFIHKKYIMSYLRCTSNVIKSPQMCARIKNIDNHNQERFLTNCMQLHGLTFHFIKQLNFIYIADDIHASTTWAKPQHHPRYPGIIKYPDQVNEVLGYLNLWDKGHRWNFINNCIMIK